MPVRGGDWVLDLCFGGLVWSLDSQAENVHWSIINIPSLLVMGLCCFAFMLIMNGGHALRWLYHNKGDSLIRYNHHLKAGSAYGFAGMLGTGIGLVQIVGGIENIEFVLPATGITILTSLYGLFSFPIISSAACGSMPTTKTFRV